MERRLPLRCLVDVPFEVPAVETIYGRDGQSNTQAAGRVFEPGHGRMTCVRRFQLSELCDVQERQVPGIAESGSGAPLLVYQGTGLCVSGWR